METTTIAVTKEIRDKINEFGMRGETFSDILERLLKSANQRLLHDLLMNSEGFISIDEAIKRHKEKWHNLYLFDCTEITFSNNEYNPFFGVQVEGCTYLVGDWGETRLSQNYPNPFNPETQISYSLAKAGHVKLAVYNVLGQKVADLIDVYQEVGGHQATFVASNLPGGLYLYRLEVGDFSKTMKMMLQR